MANKKFPGQIISDEQAHRMLSLSGKSKLGWQYEAYEYFYAFMEKLTEVQRDDVIIRLFRKV
jgi:hypothetical protein